MPIKVLAFTDDGTGVGVALYYTPSEVNALAGGFFDFSVNSARTYLNQHGHLLLESSVGPLTASGVPSPNQAGNYNGGGRGNKAIAGVDRAGGVAVSLLPRLQAEVVHNATDELGLSYNIFVDLQGNGDPADVVVLDPTSTLNGVTDKYGKSGAAASITDFDITDFALLPNTTGNAYVSGGQSLNNAFYVIGNLPSYGGALAWFDNPVNLDILLNGGTMPLTGEVFVGGFPNAVLVSCAAPDLSGAAICVQTDGGMPKGTPVTAITLQIGGSGNNLRVVTEITDLTVGTEVLLPTL